MLTWNEQILDLLPLPPNLPWCFDKNLAWCSHKNLPWPFMGRLKNVVHCFLIILPWPFWATVGYRETMKNRQAFIYRTNQFQKFQIAKHALQRKRPLWHQTVAILLSCCHPPNLQCSCTLSKVRQGWLTLGIGGKQSQEKVRLYLM